MRELRTCGICHEVVTSVKSLSDAF